jgi:hypothetical protein
VGCGIIGAQFIGRGAPFRLKSGHSKTGGFCARRGDECPQEHALHTTLAHHHKSMHLSARLKTSTLFILCDLGSLIELAAPPLPVSRSGR